MTAKQITISFHLHVPLVQPGYPIGTLGESNLCQPSQLTESTEMTHSKPRVYVAAQVNSLQVLHSRTALHVPLLPISHRVL